MSRQLRLLALFLIAPACLSAQTTKVGPARGTVIVVGGGSMGPEIYEAFIKAAGGPDALIIDVPTAGGQAEYNAETVGRAWRQAGARNVVMYHTRDRKLADSDSFTAILRKAGGIWFEGGRHFHLVDAYAGTRSEAEFNEVLARGGVVGGSSAGASILGSFLVRGAPSSNNMIMYYPGYERGFSYLKDTGIDQHVVARERLPDLADSIMPRFPKLLGISEDEGTAWVVKGDTGVIIGRSKAFAYAGRENDPGKPFLTLFPGDRYNLATRRVIRRAVDDGPVKTGFVDDLFRKYNDAAAGGATVLVAQDGKVFVAKSYGIPAQAKYMPTTTVPQFALGSLGEIFPALCAQLPAQAARGNPTPDSAGAAANPGRGGRGGNANQTPLQSCVSGRVASAVGMQKTSATPEGVVMTNVDALYRLALGLDARTFARDTSIAFDATKGWLTDTYRGVTRVSAYGTTDGKRHAFVRIPERMATVIILTNDETADAKGLAERITERLLSQTR